jgi:lantibiotic transport system permease protein
MSNTFVNAFQSEWLKKKRSLASWLVITGSFFTPAIIIVARLVRYDSLQKLYSADGFWNQLWRNSWESMAIFFLPMGAILAASLVAQIEFRNNAWKQVHALPLGLATIFFSKFAVIVLMMLQFFVLFNIAIYISAVVPWMLVGSAPYPNDPIPWAHFLKEDTLYFVDCLPIVAAQYMISLRYGNFLVPIGVGFLAWVGALGMLPWKFAFLIPYTYCMLNFLKDDATNKAAIPPINFHWLAIGWFLLFTAIGYGLFATKPQKG